MAKRCIRCALEFNSDDAYCARCRVAIDEAIKDEEWNSIIEKHLPVRPGGRCPLCRERDERIADLTARHDKCVAALKQVEPVLVALLGERYAEHSISLRDVRAALAGEPPGEQRNA